MCVNWKGNWNSVTGLRLPLPLIPSEFLTVHRSPSPPMLETRNFPPVQSQGHLQSWIHRERFAYHGNEVHRNGLLHSINNIIARCRRKARHGRPWIMDHGEQLLAHKEVD